MLGDQHLPAVVTTESPTCVVSMRYSNCTMTDLYEYLGLPALKSFVKFDSKERAGFTDVFQMALHCKKLPKYISQPVPTTGHNPDRYKWISLGYLFGSVQDDILLPNKYPCRSTPISSVCKLGCRIPFVLRLFIVQISLLVPVKIHSRYRFLPGCNWFSVLPWPHPLPCLHSSPSHTPCPCPGYTPPKVHPLPLIPWQWPSPLLP